MDKLLIALNTQADKASLRSALNVELPDGEAPDWVELIPAGPIVRGNDGRQWTFGPDEAKAVLAAFNQHLGRVVLDYEHASEHRAPQGLDAPAAAWINALELREGALWGQVEWTEKARNQIANKEYRYLSPVFLYTSDDSRRIQRLTSAGLTNQPNFALRALNQEDLNLTPNRGEQTPMWEKLLKRLGLSADATEDDAIAAIEAMDAKLKTAENREVIPNLDKFVPRTDYNTAVERATNAEQKLETFQKEKVDGEIETAINQALQDGKITPASVEYHKAQCRSEGGLERFKQFVKSAPEVAGDTDLDGKTPKASDKALNAETKAIAAMFGNSEEDLKKYGGLGDAN